MPIQLHPATVHFPIAFLLLASVAALLYLYWRQSELLRILTWWPLRLGWLGAAVAIATGLLAQSGLPPQAPYRGVLNWHITTGLLLWVLYGLLLYQQWIYQKQQRKRKGPATDTNASTAQQRTDLVEVASPLDIPAAHDLLNAPPARGWLTILFLLGIVFTLASGWNGGRLVYLWGVNVAGS